MGPIRGGGGFPPWAWRQGWAHPPPRTAHSAPLGSLVQHGGGEEDDTPLGLYKEGYTPPFSNTQLFLSLSFSFLEVDSPCLESAPGVEFSTIRQTPNKG